MPNFKKILAVSLGAVCLLASCNKTVNATDAKKFIESTYGSTELKSVSEVGVNFKITCTETDNAKAKVKVFAEKMAESCKVTLEDDKLNFNAKEIDHDSEQYKRISEEAKDKITTTQIDSIEENLQYGKNAKSVYTISNKEISTSITADEFTIETTEKITLKSFIELNIYNERGQLRYKKESCVMPISDSENITTTSIYTISFVE